MSEPAAALGAGLPEAVLRPSSGNAFELTVEQLAVAIRLGVFVAGQSLPPERELAERLAVSRNTLREAIAALRDAGLVTTRRGRGGGTVVTYTVDAGTSRPVPGGAALGDALDFRRVVEPGAAWLAATRTLAADQRSWLRECALATRDTADGAGQRIANSRFHLAIATVSGSAMLVEAVTRAQSTLTDLLAAIPVLRANIDHSNDQHDAIVDAILDGDPDRARSVAEEHCDGTSALLRGLLG